MGDFREADSRIKKLVEQTRAETEKTLSEGFDIFSAHVENAKPSRLMFYPYKSVPKNDWIEINDKRFLKGTTNKILSTSMYPSVYGYITALDFSNDGNYIVVGYSSGMIQIRDGFTGAELKTLKSIEFPPKAIWSLHCDLDKDSRMCYAACANGSIYRLRIPEDLSLPPTPPVLRKENAIYADGAFVLKSQTLQFEESISEKYVEKVFTFKSPILTMSCTSDNKFLVIGCEDSGLLVIDIETYQVVSKYASTRFFARRKTVIHKKGICAVKCHPGDPAIHASASYDDTAMIWDLRTSTGCVAEYKDVHACADSIDLNDRNLLVCGSWTPHNALTMFDLRTNGRLFTGRIQNRLRDVDGEYIYACKFWKSDDFNRKGKYAIIGGSGTYAVEVVNLHNRYIACSYSAKGSVLAVTSYGPRIAFGGTEAEFTIAEFHDPKHEDVYLEGFEGVSQENFGGVGDGANLEGAVDEETDEDDIIFCCLAGDHGECL